MTYSPNTYQRARYAAHPSDHVLESNTRGNGQVDTRIVEWKNQKTMKPAIVEGLPFTERIIPDARVVDSQAVEYYLKSLRWTNGYRMPAELHGERDQIASDAWQVVLHRVLSDTDSLEWETCDRTLYRAIGEKVREYASNRGQCLLDVAGDGSPADDIVGRNLQAETRRQAFALMALSDLAGLSRTDANVRAYLRAVFTDAVSDDSISSMRERRVDGTTDANLPASIRSENRRMHNGKVESVGRAKRDIQRGKASRRQRAAVSVSDVLAGYGFREPVARDLKPSGKVKRASVSRPVESVTVYRGECPPLETGGDIAAVMEVLNG